MKGNLRGDPTDRLDRIMSDAAAIYRETRTLKPVERLRLVEMLLTDLDQPDAPIDRLWAAEVQSRWDAHQRGELKTLSCAAVMARLDQVLDARSLDDIFGPTTH